MPNPSRASVSGPFKIRHGMTVSARANSAFSAKTVSVTTARLKRLTTQHQTEKRTDLAMSVLSVLC